LMFALVTTICCLFCVVVHCLSCFAIIHYAPYVIATHSSHCIIVAPH
jgi:hypothetical protein